MRRDRGLRSAAGQSRRAASRSRRRRTPPGARWGASGSARSTTDRALELDPARPDQLAVDLAAVGPVAAAELGGSPCPHDGSSTGVRYTVTVSTGTSTYVIGWWHFAATVTVTVPVSFGSVSCATPAPSVVPSSAVASEPPAIAVRAGDGRAASHASNASTRERARERAAGEPAAVAVGRVVVGERVARLDRASPSAG